MDKTPTMPTTASDSAKRDVIMIYSPRMAGYLMLRGFYLIRIEQNKSGLTRTASRFLTRQS